MTNNVLEIIRLILLLIVAAFIVLFGYKYYVTGDLHYSYLTPVAGLLFFYVITKPKTK